MARTSKKVLTEGAEVTRGRILQAAAHEFSQRGLSEARVESIASWAKVNLALIYYYFTNKHGLYRALIEKTAQTFVDSGLEVLAAPGSAGERLLHLVLANFNRHLYRFKSEVVLQRELHHDRGTIRRIALEIAKPLANRARDVVHEGVEAGELFDLDWMLAAHLMFGITASYFRLGPFLREMEGLAPQDAEFLEYRRKTIALAVAKVLFVDPMRGARLAEQALIDLPMDSPDKFLDWASTL